MLTGQGSQGTGQSLNVIIEHLSAMEVMIEAEPTGPWMQAVTASGLRSIDLV